MEPANITMSGPTSTDPLWITRTGQFWKLRVFFLGMLLAGAFLITMIILWSWGPTYRLYLWQGLASGAFVTVGLSALAWFALSLRCTKCGGRVGWHLLRTQPVGKWMLTLLEIRSCPLCDLGEPANTRESASRRRH